MYIALFSILIFQPTNSDDWRSWHIHIHIPLLIFGNQSITFHVTSNCYKVFVIYNVPSVLTYMMISCAEEPAPKNWDKVAEEEFNIIIKTSDWLEKPVVLTN